MSSDGKTTGPSHIAERQQRDAIENMIVIQRWPCSELEKLYKPAEKEAMPEAYSVRQGSPLLLYNAANPPPINTPLKIIIGVTPEPQEISKRGKAFIRERSLEVMRSSMKKAIVRQESALIVDGTEVVDKLLDRWTEVWKDENYAKEQHIQSPYQSTSRKTYLDSDDDDSFGKFERSPYGSGFYREKPRNAIKKTHFHSRLDDEVDPEEPRPKRSMKNYIVGHVGEHFSDFDSAIGRDSSTIGSI